MGSQSKFKCTECGLISPCLSKFREHQYLHTGQKPFNCDFCGRMFALRKYVRKHCLLVHNTESLIHTGLDTFEGIEEYDEAMLEKKSDFNIDYESKATLDPVEACKPKLSCRILRCSTCGLEFKKRSYLKQHEFTHTGLKPFSCFVCGDKFAFKRYALRHLRKRHGSNSNDLVVKANEDSMALSSVNSSTYLKLVKSKASNMFHCVLGAKLAGKRNPKQSRRKFGCSICGLKFFKQSGLRNHEFLHTGLKPFSCLLCTRKFALEDYVRKHLKKFHNRKTSEVGELYSNDSLPEELSSDKIKMDSTNFKSDVTTKFSCKFCDRKFSFEFSRIQHYRRVHGAEMNKDVTGVNQVKKEKGVDTDNTNAAQDIKDDQDSIYTKDQVIKHEDPNIHLVNPDIQLQEPEISFEDLFMKTKDTDTQLVNPDIQLVDPGIQLKDPGFKLMDPDIQLMNPDIQLVDPYIQLKDNMKMDSKTSNEVMNQFGCKFCDSKFSFKFARIQHCKRVHGAKMDEDVTIDNLGKKESTGDTDCNGGQDILKHQDMQQNRINIADQGLNYEDQDLQNVDVSNKLRDNMIIDLKTAKSEVRDQFPCEFCGKKFSLNFFLIQHCKRVHEAEMGEEEPEIDGSKNTDTQHENPDIQLEDPDTLLENPDIQLEDPDTQHENPDIQLEDPDIQLDDTDIQLEDQDILHGCQEKSDIQENTDIENEFSAFQFGEQDCENVDISFMEGIYDNEDGYENNVESDPETPEEDEDGQHGVEVDDNPRNSNEKWTVIFSNFSVNDAIKFFENYPHLGE